MPRGSFTPVGQPYPSEGKVCRAFLAEVGTKESHEQLQGTACRDKSADWALIDVRPWRKAEPDKQNPTICAATEPLRSLRADASSPK